MTALHPTIVNAMKTGEGYRRTAIDDELDEILKAVTVEFDPFPAFIGKDPPWDAKHGVLIYGHAELGFTRYTHPRRTASAVLTIRRGYGTKSVRPEQPDQRGSL